MAPAVGQTTREARQPRGSSSAVITTSSMFGRVAAMMPSAARRAPRRKDETVTCVHRFKLLTSTVHVLVLVLILLDPTPPSEVRTRRKNFSRMYATYDRRKSVWLASCQVGTCHISRRPVGGNRLTVGVVDAFEIDGRLDVMDGNGALLHDPELGAEGAEERHRV